ncbi:Peptidyl-prolyl cis-trans isomerase cyp8, partial [Quaeritorhiza haematococci]
GIEVPSSSSSSTTENINAKGTTGRVLNSLASSASSSSSTTSTTTTSSSSSSVTPSFITKDKKSQHSAHYSTNTLSASFTSTSLPVTTVNTSATISPEDYMFSKIPKGAKGYARIVTSKGNLNVEVFCYDTPRAAYNFVKLAKRGYYKNTVFHRNIKNFMIQVRKQRGGGGTGGGRDMAFSA